MEFDGYRVPTGSGCNDYTWYAVLVWCGRKPSPKYCSTKEDLTSSPYFQNNQVRSSDLGSSLLKHTHLSELNGIVVAADDVRIDSSGELVEQRPRHLRGPGQDQRLLLQTPSQEEGFAKGRLHASGRGEKRIRTFLK